MLILCILVLFVTFIDTMSNNVTNIDINIYSMHANLIMKGRGAQLNTPNKFLAQSRTMEHLSAIDDWEMVKPATEYIYEQSKTIVNEVKSPDLNLVYSANPYQGCEHGCIYCYARNTHEYWGYSAGLDFESKIVIKQNAPQLLKKQLEHKNWMPAPISLSGNTDCYQPIERQMKITRKLLEVCLDFRNPVNIITKNALLLRDLDLLKQLNELNLVKVYCSITGTKEETRRLLEPRTSTYTARFKVIETLANAGIPVGVMNAPIIPGLNDIAMHDVLQTASSAGAQWAGYTIVRLNGAVAILFKDWLHRTMPNSAQKIWHQISECHDGNVSDSMPERRLKGEGAMASVIANQFETYCRKFKLNQTSFVYNTNDFRRVRQNQLSLF